MTDEVRSIAWKALMHTHSTQASPANFSRATERNKGKLKVDCSPGPNASIRRPPIYRNNHTPTFPTHLECNGIGNTAPFRTNLHIMDESSSLR